MPLKLGENDYLNDSELKVDVTPMVQMETHQ
jgi:hypothetical protein